MKNLKKKSIGLLFTLLNISAIMLFSSCSKDDSGTSNSIAVTNISLDVSTLTLNVGKDYALIATITPDSATNKIITWTSSNTTVATVADGKVTAKTAGTTTITAKAGDKTATCMVTVNNTETTTLTFTDNASFDILSLYKDVAIKDIDVSIGVSGGTAPYTYSATNLPAGIRISSTTGIISGTPTTLSNTGGNATITVKDAKQNTASITISYGAVEEMVNYKVHIGGNWITSANKDDVLGDGTVTYNPTTNTLTLNSAYPIGQYLENSFVLTYAKIYSAENLTIHLEGSSRLTILSAFASFGILCKGNVTFTGTGNLYIGAESTAYGYSGIGIAANGADGVVFNNCGTITIATNGRAIRADNVTDISKNLTITKTCP